jgi:hypothetical protein
MSKELTIELDSRETLFVRKYSEYGFSNPNEMIRKGLELLKKELKREKQLHNSAVLYAEIYEEDEETQEWTTSALNNWVD